jgi:hypothetical protein
MAVRKICKQKGCRASPRSEHPWWFDVMHAGKRWRMRVDDFALARGATEPITSKQTADFGVEVTRTFETAGEVHATETPGAKLRSLCTVGRTIA